MSYDLADPDVWAVAERVLTDLQLEALRMSVLHGFGYGRIGRMQGVAKGTARDRVKRAEELLERELAARS